jgi:hypothetical protein
MMFGAKLEFDEKGKSYQYNLLMSPTASGTAEF